MVLYGTGDWERHDTAEDLKLYMENFHDATNQNKYLKTPSQNGKYLVIYKQISGLFPIHENILSRDWTQISDATPAPVAPIAPVAPVAPVGPNLNAITASLKSIAKWGEDRKDLYIGCNGKFKMVVDIKLNCEDKGKPCPEVERFEKYLKIEDPFRECNRIEGDDKEGLYPAMTCTEFPEDYWTNFDFKIINLQPSCKFKNSTFEYEKVNQQEQLSLSIYAQILNKIQIINK